MRREWTEEEIDALKENYGKIKLDELSIMLNRSEASIKNYAVHHNIVSARQIYHKWTDEEMEFIYDNHSKYSYAELAKKIGVSYASLRDFIAKQKLGEQKNATDFVTVTEMAKLIGKTRSSAQWWVECGLPSHKRGTYRMINPQQLFKFMKNNPQRWVAHDCQAWFFEKQPWFWEKYEKERECWHERI